MITLGTLIVTDDDLGAIAHAVHNETPEQWATRAFNYPKGGEAAVVAKIAKYKPAYMAAKDEPGYKTAAENETDRQTARKVQRDQAIADAGDRKTAEEAAMDARITAEVAKQLATR